MKEKILHYAKEIVLFIVVMTLFANAISLYKSQDLSKAKLALTTHKLINTNLYTPLTNKPLLVHVWATWCPVCKAEADNIQRVSEHYEVITIAVNSGTDYEIHNYMKERDLNFRVINDKKSVLAKELNIAVYPTTFIYDKNGNLVFSEVGYTSSFGLWIRMLYASFK